MTQLLTISKCPICGKQPYLIRDHNYETMMGRSLCTIRCKPLLRKEHLRVVSEKESWQSAFLDAVGRWNEYCMNYAKRKGCDEL